MEKQDISTLAQTVASENERNFEAYSLEVILSSLNELPEKIYDDYLSIIFDSYQQLYDGIWKIYARRFQILIEQKVEDADFVREEEVEMLNDMYTLLNEFKEQQWPIISTYFEKGTIYYIKYIDDLVNSCVETDYREWEREELEVDESDGAKARRIKYWARIRTSLSGGTHRQKVNLQKIVRHYVSQLLLMQTKEYLQAFELAIESSMEGMGHFLKKACQEWELVIGTSYDKGAKANTFKESFRKIEVEYEEFSTKIAGQRLYFRNQLIEIHQRFGKLVEGANKKIEGVPSLKPNFKEEARIRQSLFGQGKNWQHAQGLWYNKLRSKIILLTVRARLTQLTRIVKNELRTTYFQRSEENINQLRGQIQKLVSDDTPQQLQRELANDLFQIKDDLFVSDNQLIEGALGNAHDAIDDLPTNTVLINPNSREAIQVPMASLVNYLTQTHFFAPLQEELQNLPHLFKRLYFRVQDSTRLIAFNLQPENLGKRAAKDNLTEVLKKAEQDVSLTYQELQLLLDKLDRHVDEKLMQTLGYLSISSILAEAEKLKRSLRSSARLKSLREVWLEYTAPVTEFFRKIMKFLGIKRAHFLSREWEENNPDRNIHALLRNFVEKVTPRERILQALPFYYQQLFIGKEILITTLLKHRELELAEAKAAAVRLQQGIGGGILVIGEPLSGKSYFCQHIATHCFPKQHYLIKPPLTGSINSRELTRAFQKSMQQSGTLSQLVESSPLQTVFVLDDLELWWERSENGIQILETIFELIDQYGKDYFFIINCNMYSYHLFQQLTNIHLYFASTIHLTPMDSQEIKAILLDRHFSGANALEWKGKLYENVRAREINRLFRRYHSLTEGNIGMALRLWLGSIIKVNEGKITIREPRDIEMPQINESDWLLMLSQFILHKRLTVNKISRIYQGTDPAMLNSLITSLVRAGLIEQVGRHAYQINSYLTSDVIRQLKEAQLL